MMSLVVHSAARTPIRREHQTNVEDDRPEIAHRTLTLVADPKRRERHGSETGEHQQHAHDQPGPTENALV